MENEGDIKEVDRLRRRAASERYFVLVEEENQVKKEIYASIQEIFKKLGIEVSKEFERNIMEQKTYILRVFHRQLLSNLVAEDKHDGSTWPLWIETLDSLGLDRTLSERVSNDSHPRQETNNLKMSYDISPALLAIVYFLRKE